MSKVSLFLILTLIITFSLTSEAKADSKTDSTIFTVSLIGAAVVIGYGLYIITIASAHAKVKKQMRDSLSDMFDSRWNNANTEWNLNEMEKARNYFDQFNSLYLSDSTDSYIKKHYKNTYDSSGKAISKIDRQLDSILYSSALESNIISSFEHYLSIYPSGIYSEDARNKIAAIKHKEYEDENQLYSAALTAHDLLLYKQYAERYPNSNNIDQIRNIITTIEKARDDSLRALRSLEIDSAYSKTRIINTFDSYSSFLKSYTDARTPFKDTITNILDSLAKIEADKVERQRLIDQKQEERDSLISDAISNACQYYKSLVQINIWIETDNRVSAQSGYVDMYKKRQLVESQIIYQDQLSIAKKQYFNATKKNWSPRLCKEINEDQ